MKYIRTKTFITELENWMKVDNETLIIGGVGYKIVAEAEPYIGLCAKTDREELIELREKRTKNA